MVTYLQTFGSEEQKDKFILLYDKYRNLMFYISNGILHDDYLAEDVLQESFTLILKNLEYIHDPFSSETRRFISVIVRNISLNMLKKRSHEKPVEDISKEVYYITNYYNSSQDEFFSNYNYEEIVNAVKSLPASLRDPLLLYVSNGMSTKEISTLLNISISAVHKRIQRARERIKTHLKKGEDYEYL